MIGRADLRDRSVRDVMDPEPKTTPAGATVAELRAWFAADPHLRTALLTDGERFVGAVHRDDLPAGAPGDLPAAGFAHPAVRSIGPDQPAERALAELDGADDCRLIVLSENDRALVGLVCMNSTRSHFCVPRHMA
jgi:CBS domain containing-hemolysin-like protein